MLLRKLEDKFWAWRRRNAEFRLRDEIYALKYWSFADTPEFKLKRMERIERWVVRCEELGSDVLIVLPYGYEYLAARAYPERYETVFASGQYRVRRKRANETLAR